MVWLGVAGWAVTVEAPRWTRYCVSQISCIIIRADRKLNLCVKLSGPQGLEKTLLQALLSVGFSQSAQLPYLLLDNFCFLRSDLQGEIAVSQPREMFSMGMHLISPSWKASYHVPIKFTPLNSVEGSSISSSIFTAFKANFRAISAKLRHEFFNGRSPPLSINSIARESDSLRG